MRRAVVVVIAVAALSLAAAVVVRSTRSEKTAGGARGSTPAHSSGSAGDSNAFTGTVAETMNSGGYTYARLQGGKDDVWIAAREFRTQTGDRLTVALEMPMQNFESKTLHRTFPLVYFVAGVMRDGQRVDPQAGAESAGPPPGAAHPPASVPTSNEHVAPPPGGMAIADVWTRRSELAGREVTVRGKVVKVNDQIMGRNWIHLQDGSGSAGDRTNDLTITTDESFTVGEVITVAGVLAVNKDFGAGYAYGAIVENARRIK